MPWDKIKRHTRPLMDSLRLLNVINYTCISLVVDTLFKEKINKSREQHYQVQYLNPFLEAYDSNTARKLNQWLLLLGVMCILKLGGKMEIYSIFIKNDFGEPRIISVTWEMSTRSLVKLETKVDGHVKKKTLILSLCCSMYDVYS